MTQRYVLPDQAAAEHEFLPANAWWRFEAKFNVSPGQFIPAIRLHAGQSEGVMLRWGLIPAWFEGDVSGAPKSSVRSVRVEESKLYQAAWRSGQRCIVPVAGFYGWQLTQANHRQPFLIRLLQRGVFGLAAVWDRWVSPEDDVIEGCAVVTVPGNDLVRDLVDPRVGMPAILRRKDYAVWLSGTPAAAKAVLQPYNAAWMEAYAVSPRVNSTSVDDPGLIRHFG